MMIPRSRYTQCTLCRDRIGSTHYVCRDCYVTILIPEMARYAEVKLGLIPKNIYSSEGMLLGNKNGEG
jgi:hypothetical protein